MKTIDEVLDQAPPAFGAELPERRRRGWLGPYLLGVLSGGVLLCVIGAVIVGGWIVYISSEPEGISVTVQGPKAPAVGDTIRISVQISNDSASAQRIAGFEIWNDLLNGVYIAESDPAFDGWSRDSGRGYQSEVYHFESLRLAPGKTMALEIIGEAVAEGSFSGDVDVYIGEAGRIVSRDLSITIKAGAASGAPPF